MFWGHSRNDHGAGVPESLADHIRRVDDFAKQFSGPLQLSAAASISALMHDIGKYSDRFNSYVQGMPGCSSPDHWSAGARLVISALGGHNEQRFHLLDAIRLVIESHHSQLSTLSGPRESARRLDEYFKSNSRLKCDEFSILMDRWRKDGFQLPGLGDERLSSAEAAAMLESRLLYSCLVDADFLATEGHFNGDFATPYQPRDLAPEFDFGAAAEHLESVMSSLPNSQPEMQWVRDHVGVQCRERALDVPGLFTLTAPTGSGKTLAMLLFAFRHAQKQGHRRIVFVMPFLTIVSQTAQVIHSALSSLPGFDPSWVLEDHGLAGRNVDGSADSENPEEMELVREQRLEADNWDAPIILTSSVKCLESLHANRPSVCRKLHRLAKSVLIFDEVQTLPPKLASLTLATLTHLSQRFGSTVLFATATQPAFEMLESEDRPPLPNLRSPSQLSGNPWAPTEILPEHGRLFKATAGRVKVKWWLDEELPLSEVASKIAKSDRSSLAIVNLKRHATQLFQEIRDRRCEVYHLSTSMCAEHRDQTLKLVRNRLAEGKPVKLVSTQCIEAGVDFPQRSFEGGWRSMAPLPSIAQAAGRINRSFEYSAASVLNVFRPNVEGAHYPPGYGAGITALQTLLTSLREEGIHPDETELISSPELMQRYYAILYGLTGETAMTDKLLAAVEGLDFEGVSSEYRLIGCEQRNILVGYTKTAQENLLAWHARPNQQRGWTRDWMRAARPYTVTVYEFEFKKLAAAGCLFPIPFGAEEHLVPEECRWWALPEDAGHYDPNVGLEVPQEDGLLEV